METRTLGNSDLQITRIGFGAWAIGGGRSPGQVRGIAAAADLQLSDEDVRQIEQFRRENP